MIIAPNDVRDAHVHVIDDDTEIVGRRSVPSRDDEIVQFAVLKNDSPVHLVFHHHFTIRTLCVCVYVCVCVTVSSYCRDL